MIDRHEGTPDSFWCMGNVLQPGICFNYPKECGCHGINPSWARVFARNLSEQNSLKSQRCTVEPRVLHIHVQYNHSTADLFYTLQKTVDTLIYFKITFHRLRTELWELCYHLDGAGRSMLIDKCENASARTMDVEGGQKVRIGKTHWSYSKFQEYCSFDQRGPTWSWG